MKPYVFIASRNPSHNTQAVALPDGRGAGVGQEIVLNKAEFDELNKYVVLLPATEDKEEEEAVEVTDLPELPKVSGTVVSEFSNN